MSAQLLVLEPDKQEVLYLGKLLCDDANNGVGVWYPGKETDEVARMALDFLVRNVGGAKLEVLLDTVASTLYVYTDFRHANEDYEKGDFWKRPKKPE